MKITAIKAALAEKAKSMNVQPIPAAHPVKASTTPKSTASAVKATKKETKEQSHKDVPAATKAPITNADINSIIAANLQAGVDYAVIPGCGRKPALLKAGAEHLAAIFDYRSTCTILNRFADYQQKFVLYEVQTTIRDAAGNVIAEGIGSCNSRERNGQEAQLRRCHPDGLSCIRCVHAGHRGYQQLTRPIHFYLYS